MRNHAWSLLAVLVLSSAALIGCGTPAPKCSSTTCTGCCDATGQCQAGDSPLACGVSGGLCSPCGAASCAFGVCTSSNTGGGSASGGGTGGTGGGSGGGGAANGLQSCLDYVAAQAGLLQRCPQYTPAGLAEYRAAAEARCRTEGLSRSLKDGRTTINTSAFTSCLAALNAAACTASQSPASCAEVFVGAVAENGACFNSQDCVSSTYCDTSMTCPGRCVARTAIGQQVPPGGECVTTAYDNAGTCTAAVAFGQSCAPIGGSTQTQRCQGYAVCVNGVCGDYVGPPRQTAGQPCGPTTQECAMGLQCISGSCAPYGAVGAACDSVRFCLNDLICNTANVCAAKGAAGTACTSSGRECRAETFCNVPTGQTNGTCTARRTLDQTCGAFFHCVEPLYCTGTTSAPGVCKPYGTVGATCSFTGQYGQCGTLSEFLYCTATQAAPMGVCANQKSTGASCTRYQECRTGCTNGTCTAPTFCQDETP